MRQSKGFTLIELLIVVAIICIGAVVLYPVLRDAREKARAAEVKLSRALQIKEGDRLELVFDRRLYKATITEITRPRGKLSEGHMTFNAWVTIRKAAKLDIKKEDGRDDKDGYGANLDEN